MQRWRLLREQHRLSVLGGGGVRTGLGVRQRHVQLSEAGDAHHAPVGDLSTIVDGT